MASSIRDVGLGCARQMSMLPGLSALALMLALPPLQARPLGGSSTAATASAVVASQAAALQAAQQASVSIQRATQAVRNMQLLQQGAAAAGPGANAIPNGLVPGGLVPDSGLAFNPGGALVISPSWSGIGAVEPTQSGGNTVIDIAQNQNKAILNWTNFNIGSKTIVNFLQGDSSWIALNRIDDPSGVPSQILGQINAPGMIYLINRNGIIFGAGSQVNLTGLIASSLDVGSLGMNSQQRNQFFSNNGINNPTSGFSFSVSSTQLGGDFNTNGNLSTINNGVAGSITVNAGASITTTLTPEDSPGFVFLFGANVTNNGSINSPAGEVAMVAARTISVTAGSYSFQPISGGTARNQVLPPDPASATGAPVTFRGYGINFSQFVNASFYSSIGAPTPTNSNPNLPYLAGTGAVTQGGLITTTRGTALLAGDTIGVSGVISANTSVTRNSSVFLDAITSVNLSGTISIQPDENGDTLPFLNGAATANTPSQVQAFIPGFVFMSGDDITLAPTGLISAPSATVKLQATALAANLPINNEGASFYANVSVTTPQQIWLAPGAIVDVAGLQNVELPAMANFIAYNPTGTEVSNDPMQRAAVAEGGLFYGRSFYIDVRASGTLANGSTWLGTPLGNANGFIDDVPQSIDVLMTKGGAVSLTTDLSGGPLRGVVLQPGSVINVGGGYVQYLPGNVPNSVLIDAYGRRTSMADADPSLSYIAIGGYFMVAHPAWGLTDIYPDGVTPTTNYQQGYLQGSDAGGITISTLDPVILGTLLFGSIDGERQLALGELPSDAINIAPSGLPAVHAPSQNSPYQLPSQGYLSIITPASVMIGSDNNTYNAATSPLPAIPTKLYTSTASVRVDLSAAKLSAYDLSALSITASDLTLTKGSELDMAPGGAVSFTTAGAMDLQGTIVAHSGNISLISDGYDLTTSYSNSFTLPVSAGNVIAAIRVSGLLNTTGLWVNDSGISTPALATGNAFINGGNISITTNDYSTSGHADATGSVILANGSVLDASSGGYLGADGKVETSAYLVASGTGGNITLAVYQGTQFGQSGSGAPYSNQTNAHYANVVIDPTAVMRSYGFTDDGQLTISVPLATQIGGQPNAATNFWLPASFLNAGGFSEYILQSSADHRISNVTNLFVNSSSITLASGTTLDLQQRNFSLQAVIQSNPPTGTPISQTLPVVVLADDQRQPTSLTLGADYITLGAGSIMTTDPGASVTLRGTQTLAATSDQGSISTLLLGQIVNHGGSVTVEGLHIWFGSGALIDVTGKFVASSSFSEFNALSNQGSADVNGTLLSGGNVTLSTYFPSYTPGTTTTATTSPYLIGQNGATIDVSGATANLQSLGSSTPVYSWTDGGTLTINASTMLWDGRFVAKAGDPQGNGGTLIIGGGPVYLAQSVTALAAGNLSAALARESTPTSASALGPTLDTNLGPFAPDFGGRVASNQNIFNGDLDITIDKLGQFDTIYLYSGEGMKPAEYFSTISDPTALELSAGLAQNLATVGNINWTVGQRLYIGAQAIVPTTPATATTVAINSPYVLLTTWGQSSATAASGSGLLTIRASDDLDVESAVFSGFAVVNLTSAGDLRLSTPRVFEANSTNGLANNPYTFSGLLTAPAALNLTAQRIYPVSDVGFTITASSVNFAAPAGSNTASPLSAGGSVTVAASNITQNGNLFAPLGQITLGTGTATNITLGAGSLTSVSLGNNIVPFGTTEDGTNWYYNDDTHPLTVNVTATNFLPTKVITLNGQNVSLQSGATVNVNGGGDLQANEFAAGTGGTVDTLAQPATGPAVYALVPSSSAAVAAFDIDFIYRQGDAQPLAGRQVYLAGGNGIAAGLYTLLPAHYATTLPGALRVVDGGPALAKPGQAGLTLPDGTQMIAGYYTQSTDPGGRSSGTELFSVQTRAVWQPYSQYNATSANAYFYNQSVLQGVNVPYLPVDAGQLSIVAQASLTLHETALAAAVGSGRPGQLDLSASQIDLIGPGQTAPAGYVGIDVTEINGFGSVLVGGLRTNQANGTTLITANASEILVDTGGYQLTAPELILVATPTVSATQNTAVSLRYANTSAPGLLLTLRLTYSVLGPAVANTGNIIIDPGSAIDSTGLTGNTFARSYLPSSSSAAAIAALLSGTLNSTGTVINNADITQLKSPSTALQAALNAYAGPQGFGAMIAMTNDPLLSIANLSGANNPTLAINFGTATTVSTSVLTLQAGTTNNIGTNIGAVSIAANTLLQGHTLTIEATGATSAISLAPSPQFKASQINLVAQNFGFGSGAVNAAVALTPSSFDGLAAGRSVALQALNAGGLDFYGTMVLDPTQLSLQPSLGLTFDAGYLAEHNSGTVSISSAGTITLQNSGTSSSISLPTAITGTSLTLLAPEIDLGGGSQIIAGFSAVNVTANNLVFVKNSGVLQLGTKNSTGSYQDTVNLTVTTPNVLVGAATSSGGGSEFQLSTNGGVTINGGTGGAPAATSQNGGYLEIDAGFFDLSGTIQAQAGTLVVQTSGTETVSYGSYGSAPYGILLRNGAYIAAGGVAQSFFDSVRYLPGGKVTFTAGQGDVLADAGSTINVAQPVVNGQIGLGYGGEFDVTASDTSAGIVMLNGTINGAGGTGHGGIFRLNAQRLASLDALADALYNGGSSGEIDIQIAQGNLVLSQGHTLKAYTVNLTADAPPNADDTVTTPASNNNGNISISGTIDARGASNVSDGANEAGGQVGLWGDNSVTLFPTARILASTDNPAQLGGNVSIGVGWSAPWIASPNGQAGGINLQPGSVIDVHGGSAGGLSGGTVTLRAPLDGNNDLKIQQIGSNIVGSRAIYVEGFISFDTSDGSGSNTTNSPTGGLGINGNGIPVVLNDGTMVNVVYDGIIDPSGNYGPSGNLLPGSFTNITGYQLNVSSGALTAVPTGTISVTGGGGSGAAVQASLQVTAVSISSNPATATFTSTIATNNFPTVTVPTPNNANLQNVASGSNLNAAASFTVNATISNLQMPSTTVDQAYAGTQNVYANGVLIGTTNVTVSNGVGTWSGVILSNGVTVSSNITRVSLGNAANPPTAVISQVTYQIASVNVAAGGQGYTTAVTPTVSTNSDTGVAVTFNPATMGLQLTVTNVGTGYNSAPSVTGLTGSNQASFALNTTLTGALTGSGTFTPSSYNYIPLASNGLTTAQGSANFTATTPYLTRSSFYTNVLASVAQGNWSYSYNNVTYNYGFTNAQARLGNSVIMMPGIQLINSSTAVNNGDITVLGNWNLAAGTAYNANGTPLLSGGSYNAATNYLALTYRLGLQPGALSLIATNNVNVEASISDGFFQFQDYSNANYQAALLAVAAGGSTGYVDASSSVTTPYYYAISGYQTVFQAATYNSVGNSTSPTGAALNVADLFPSTLALCTANCATSNPTTTSVNDPASWSIRVTAGADIGSANPNATQALSANATNGNVTISSHSTYSVYGYAGFTGFEPVNVPTMLRTGTGSINISAARDLVLSDTAAPGVIYTAGVNMPLLPGPQWNATTSTFGNPSGFLQPQLLLESSFYPEFGAANAAAFPEMAGNITIHAGLDAIGFQNVQNPGQKSALSFAQFYVPWLMSTVVDNNQTDLVLGAGAFLWTNPTTTPAVEQSAWWIQFSSFDQGVMSVGGNVSLTAGRDVRDFSVSLPSTGRVSGGLAFGNTPVLNSYGSGNLTVNVGRTLASGSFYEGSGSAVIQVRGSVTSDWQTGTTPVDTVLAVDSGQLALMAGSSIALAGVVNPAQLRQQSAISSAAAYSMQVYGPDSAVSLLAAGGDITLAALPKAFYYNSSLIPLFPSSFSAIAFGGSVNVQENMILADSLAGSLELLAENNITIGSNIGQSSAVGYKISSGASMIDEAFDPFAPNNGFDASASSPVLAHAGQGGVNYLYAATGTIQGVANSYIASTRSSVKGSEFESNRALAVQAGLDILNLDIVIENANVTDVSSVIAGRDISYTGANNAIQIAGPGFLQVEAGRNLGPFLPLSADSSTLDFVASGILSVGNAGILVNLNTSSSNLVPFPVGNEPATTTTPYTSAPPNQEFVGTAAGGSFKGSSNFLLPSHGASIVTMFGVARGVDYQAVIETYVDPANAANVPYNYLGDLSAFLAGLGIKDANGNDMTSAEAWSEFPLLSPRLQQIFADQVFFSELKSVGIPDTPSFGQYQRGYTAINLMFPADVNSAGLYGYTRNNLSGGTNGANTLVSTGDLNMLHATIQTQQGGDVSIFGPGGSILVGSAALEPNTKNLKPYDLGILTLAGGAINTFTDANVLINQSRVFTIFGGDILMWSSNGDINAGQGARTTLSFPPLTVQFNRDDLETVNLGGEVSGAGIAVLRTLSFAVASDAYLIAPRGTIDAGDAGIRVAAGRLSVLAVQIANSVLITAQTSNLPVFTPPALAVLPPNNIGTTTSQTVTSTAAQPSVQSSVIIVEVIGYGCDRVSDCKPPPGVTSEPATSKPAAAGSPPRPNPP